MTELAGGAPDRALPTVAPAPAAARHASIRRPARVYPPVDARRTRLGS